MFSRFSIQRNSSPFCWSCALTHRSRQQILFPLMAQEDTNSPKMRRMFLIFSFKFRIFLASLHAAWRAHRSCHSVSFWDRYSNFGALELRWWRSPGQIIHNDGFWSRMYAWRATALVNFTRRIDFSVFEHFGGSISWNTQPNCRVIFNLTTALLSPFFLRLLALLFINLAMRMRTLFPKSASIFGLVEQAFWKMPFFTYNGLVQIPLK